MAAAKKKPVKRKAAKRAGKRKPAVKKLTKTQRKEALKKKIIAHAKKQDRIETTVKAYKMAVGNVIGHDKAAAFIKKHGNRHTKRGKKRSEAARKALAARGGFNPTKKKKDLASSIPTVKPSKKTTDRSAAKASANAIAIMAKHKPGPVMQRLRGRMRVVSSSTMPNYPVGKYSTPNEERYSLKDMVLNMADRNKVSGWHPSPRHVRKKNGKVKPYTPKRYALPKVPKSMPARSKRKK